MKPKWKTMNVPAQGVRMFDHIQIRNKTHMVTAMQYNADGTLWFRFRELPMIEQHYLEVNDVLGLTPMTITRLK